MSMKFAKKAEYEGWEGWVWKIRSMGLKNEYEG